MEGIKRESIEQPSHLVELALELEQMTDDNEEAIRLKLRELLEGIEKELHVRYSNNANELYEHMRQENCLVRVDTLSRVLETLIENKKLRIADNDESHYANATLPVSKGIKIAFAEGQAPGPLRVAMTFGKTIIGFKTDHIEVKEIDFSDRPDAEERRYLCRHVVGELEKEDIVSIVIRIPRHAVDESLLTEKESTSKSPFIIRGLNIR